MAGEGYFRPLLNRNSKKPLTMNKLLLLLSIFAFTAPSLRAQGYFNPVNGGTGVSITVQDPTLNGGVPVNVGTPATAAGFAGAGPGQVTITMYAAINGTALSALENAANIVCITNNSQEHSQAGQAAYSGPINLPVKSGYNGSAPVEFILYGVDATGNYKGWSTETTVTPTVGSAGAPLLFGTAPGQINSFELSDAILVTPEPSVLALAGAGAAALLFFRRRKQFTATHFS